MECDPNAARNEADRATVSAARVRVKEKLHLKKTLHATRQK